MASNSGMGSGLLGHYDKLVALAGLVFLGVSAFLFVGGRATTESETQTFRDKIKRLTPDNPDVVDISSRIGSYAVPISRIAKPLQISNDRTKRVGFFVPEMRIWCVRNDCRFPLAPDWTKCPQCGTEQSAKPIESVNADSDGDGMPDEWERKYDLNPQDPADAELDSDEDGFTNLQEYKDGTDPLDAKSHKDFATLLRVVKIEATPLPIVFKGFFMENKDGKQYSFAYQKATLRAKVGDQIANVNDKIDSGFKLVSINEDAEVVENKATGMKTKLPTAVVSSGDKTFTLSVDKIANDTDYKITIAKDFGDKGEIIIDGGKEFRIGDKVYRVVKADKEALKAVIRCDADKSEVTITKDGASK
jgi:hypothetical protein